MPGQWRLSLDVAQGTFRTSHVAECPDVAPECETTIIPAHLHRAAVELTHVETTISYGIRERMQLSLRVPYDVKAMTIGYETLDGAPFTPPYGDIHHRTQTLRGLSDPTLHLDWMPRRGWTFGAGLSLPLGDTVENPIRLGREGKTHQHMQFGSGTFRPTLSAQWVRPLDRVTLFARAETRLSLYENDEGFRAPNNVLWSVGPSIRLGGATLNPRLQGQVQTLGKWDDEPDEGDGFTNAGVRLQLALPQYRGISFAPAVYREIYSHGHHHEEEFRQGTTWSVSMTRSF
ncbi:MAG TPA: hypothetical protein VGQ76_27920 [Thermoanaerobaculia bacterium]|jgi:hypothetical protein|nr:hypothetical protein [Thermoanaerobaculia bacterium]